MSLSSKWVCQLKSECKHMIHSSSTSDSWMMGLQTRGRWKPVRTHSYRVSGRLQMLAINYVATNLPYSAWTKTQNQNPRCNNQRPSWYEPLKAVQGQIPHGSPQNQWGLFHSLSIKCKPSEVFIISEMSCYLVNYWSHGLPAFNFL